MSFIHWRQIYVTNELGFKQPGFSYSACESFTKAHERIQKIRKTVNLKQDRK